MNEYQVINGVGIIPTGAISIEKYAFYECINLKNEATQKAIDKKIAESKINK